MRRLLLLTTALAGVGMTAAHGQTCTLGSLAYTVSGGVSSQVYQNLNGQMDLMVWGEGGQTQSAVNLGTTYSTVSVFDPTVSSAPIQTLNNVSSVNLAVTDHPLILQLGQPVGGTPASGLPVVQAKSSAAFVANIGVDAHVGYPGVYGNANLELQELNYLGINLVRDQAPSAASMPKYVQLAQSLVQFDLITSPGGQDVASTLPGDIANIAALATAVPGSVKKVEAPNELNGGQVVYMNGSPSTNASTGVAIVQAVSAAVRSNPVLAAQAVGVVNVSINNGGSGWQAYVAGLGNLSAYVTDANWHVYFNGMAPAANITSMYQNALQSAPSDPVVFTETGYSTQPGGTSVGQQASYTLDLLADASKLGVQQVYLYELMDGASGDADPENNYGLFYSDGSPKPVATALRNMITVLEGSPTAATTQQQAAYEQCAAPSTVMTTPTQIQIAAAPSEAAQAVAQQAPNLSISDLAALATQASTPSASIASTAQLAIAGGTGGGVWSDQALAALLASVPSAVPVPVVPLRTVNAPTGTMPVPTPMSNAVSFSEAGDFQTMVPAPGNASGTVSGTGNTIVSPGGIQTISVTGPGNTLRLGPYNDTVTLSTAGNTVDGGGGLDTVILTYGGGSGVSLNADLPAVSALAKVGNVFVAPPPGMGMLTIRGTLASNDTIDMTKALTGLAGYNGQILWDHVSLSASSGGCTIAVDGQVVVTLPGGSPGGQLGAFLVAH